MILTNFFVLISCFKLLFQHDQNKFLMRKFTNYINKGSVIWKIMFFALKNIQTVVLIILFINGAKNFNTMEHLGYLIFFVIFTTNEALYRRTSLLLTIFVAGMIMA